MTLEMWVAFALASLVLLILPGPTILLVVAQSMRHGKSVALSSVSGVFLGDICATTLSLAGLGVILATSATLFTIVKWAGALYLVYLGLKAWRHAGNSAENDLKSEPVANLQRQVFTSSFLVTTFNPKGIVFFMAFAPQFIDPAGSFLIQAGILIATFSVLGFINAGIYAFFAAQLGGVFSSQRARRMTDYLGGTFLIGAGIATAALKRG